MREASICALSSTMSRGYLLVRVDGKAYGLPLARVLEVGDLAEVLDVPRALPAMRGLTPLRGRLVPVVHLGALLGDRKSTRLNSSHRTISYAVFCLKKKKIQQLGRYAYPVSGFPHAADQHPRDIPRADDLADIARLALEH